MIVFSLIEVILMKTFTKNCNTKLLKFTIAFARMEALSSITKSIKIYSLKVN